MAEEKGNNDTKTVKVASIQAPSIFKDTQANIKLFTKLIKEAAKNGAKFIVLPEAAITGYASQDFKHSWCLPLESRRQHLDKNTFTAHDPEPYAEYKDGEMVQYFQNLCKELKIYLTVPYVEKVECLEQSKSVHFITFQNKFFQDYKYKYYNTITLINPDGNIGGHYRKCNLWPYYDYPWATPGNELVTVDTEYGKIGLGICFDIHKILNGYKQLNIWCLLYCIAWVDDEEFKWFSHDLPQILNTKKIKYNVIGCNWSVRKYKIYNNKEKTNDDEKRNDDQDDNDGDDDGDNNDENKVEMNYDWDGYGKTHLYGPKGKIIAFTDNLYDDEIIYADIPYDK